MNDKLQTFMAPRSKEYLLQTVGDPALGVRPQPYINQLASREDQGPVTDGFLSDIVARTAILSQMERGHNKGYDKFWEVDRENLMESARYALSGGDIPSAITYLTMVEFLDLRDVSEAVT